MSERIRSVTIELTVDTNKQTIIRHLTIDPHEDYETFIERLAVVLHDAIGDAK